MKDNEEHINVVILKEYGLENEVSCEVPEKSISVHRIFDTKEDIPVSMDGSYYVRTKRDEIVSLISYSVGCMFGRYSLDKKESSMQVLLSMLMNMFHFLLIKIILFQFAMMNILKMI